MSRPNDNSYIIVFKNKNEFGVWILVILTLYLLTTKRSKGPLSAAIWAFILYPSVQLHKDKGTSVHFINFNSNFRFYM